MQRTREINVRIAVGAQKADILRLIFTSAAWMVAGGLAAGLVLSYILTPLLGSPLVGIPPHDWLTFLTIATVLVVSGLLACFKPAARATRIDPMECLRLE